MLPKLPILVTLLLAYGSVTDSSSRKRAEPECTRSSLT